jgi:hypothetical protein
MFNPCHQPSKLQITHLSFELLVTHGSTYKILQTHPQGSTNLGENPVIRYMFHNPSMKNFSTYI